MADIQTAVTIKLGYGQLSMASHVAVMRRASNMLKQIAPKHGATNGEGSWEIDINGCCAELAVARYLNLFWCGALNNFRARDVGGLVDVRSRSKHHYQLILHPDDPDDVPFVLVWAHPPDFELTGWLLAREGKQQEFWSDPAGGRPAFFVPKERLHPMAALREWVDDRVRSHFLS